MRILIVIISKYNLHDFVNKKHKNLFLITSFIIVFILLSLLFIFLSNSYLIASFSLYPDLLIVIIFSSVCAALFACFILYNLFIYLYNLFLLSFRFEGHDIFNTALDLKLYIDKSGILALYENMRSYRLIDNSILSHSINEQITTISFIP